MTKNILFLLVLLLGSTYAQATIWTVSNSGGTPAQFSDLQIAHNTALAGDTLFVHASGFTYGDVQITKTITIIGEGYSGATTTTIHNVDFTNINASNSSLIGLKITGDIDANLVSSGSTVDAVSIERCYLMDNTGTTYNARIEGTKIISRGNNWIIRHCIVVNTELCYGYARSSPAYGTGWIIANNWIHNNDNATTTTTYTINELNGAIIENNYILDTDNAIENTSNSIVKNNMFDGVLDLDDNNDPSNVIQNNLANNALFNATNGNLPNTTPLFVVGATYPSFNVLTTADLQLQPSSLANGAGVGGTDMGIHGGATPMPLPPYDGKAAKPSIEQLIIQNPVVGQGQFLKFNIEAKTRD
ncbi:MAG: hypothetical protein ACRBFS_26775 [Aureispira sp.]